MYSFANDYSEGAHPDVLAALVETNLKQTPGYSNDDYCKDAKEAIKKHLHKEDVDIHFLVGGTQANLTVIAASLKPYQAVLSVDIGHINTHETGAIEATGHKVLTVPSDDGKITVLGIDHIMTSHIDEHMVMPKMVYISNPTELGTIYSVNELQEIYRYCKQHGLYLFIDGARLASALAIKENSVTLEDLGKYCDVFTIGGTKCGALFGEAVVICHPDLKQDFRYMIKQRGGMLAKGRLLGVQFLTLFKENLYEEIGAYENKLANQMKQVFFDLGLTFLADSPSNQLFPILPDDKIKVLAKKYQYTHFERVDDHHSCIRLVTSFATDPEIVAEFIKDVQNIFKK